MITGRDLDCLVKEKFKGKEKEAKERSTKCSTLSV